MYTFIKLQLNQVSEGGWKVFYKKIGRFLPLLFSLPFYLLAIPVVFIGRMISPWFLLRVEELFSSRIGHFAANTELFLCDRDAGFGVPQKPYIDLFYLQYGPVSNRQLEIMWKRVLNIGPYWLLHPIKQVNKLFPGWVAHSIPVRKEAVDIYGLLDKQPPHLSFTTDEEEAGIAGLKKIGVAEGSKFVCLLVRDSLYLNNYSPGDNSYHNYRDCNIQDYKLAAEYLADNSYYVIRMGALVKEPLASANTKIIDYASNGMRTEFMDIYLGAKCEFCISTGAGWDLVPSILFRRPVLFTNLVPMGYFPTSTDKFLMTTRRHWNIATKRELTLSEIFEFGLAFSLKSKDYEDKEITLINNTPEELKNAVQDMLDKLNGLNQESQFLNILFWNIFMEKVRKTPNGSKLHGIPRAAFSESYLKDNQFWLQ